MALEDVAKALTSGVPHKTCGTCYHLSQMSPKHQKLLRDLLADRGVKIKDIAQKLRDDPEAPEIKVDALSRHARGGCDANEHLR